MKYKNLTGKKRFNYEFIILTGAAFFLSFIPYVDIPFTWTMTFFHEISHGLAALLTGGAIDKIEIHLIGSGLCYTIGGSRFFVLQAGYIGAVIWGMIIYSMADRLNHKNTTRLAALMVGFIAFSAIFYSRDIITWGILLVLIGLFVCVIKLDRKSTRLNSSHTDISRMPSSA